MITTVTVNTLNTITGLSAILSMIVIVTFIIFSMIKHLAGTPSGDSLKFLVKSLEVSMVPLFIALAMIVSVKVVEILGFI